MIGARLKPRWSHTANGDFVRRQHYDISVTNTASQQQVFGMRGRRWGLLTCAVGLFLAIGGLWLILFIYTPMRNILPVKMQSDLRNEYVQLNHRLGDVADAARINQQYLDNVWAILRDSVPPQEVTLDQASELEIVPLDSLLESSARERSFVARFENAERFNVSVLSPLAAEGMTFYPPVMGVATEEKVNDSGIPYIQATPAKSSPISAVYRGTVLNTYFTTGKGITVVIQHPNDFVSEYSGLADCFVSRGDKVVAGTRIGIAQENRYPFLFELWHNGSPLSPRDYILF